MFAAVFVPESEGDVTSDWMQNTVLKGHIEKDFKVVQHSTECMTKSTDREGFTSQMVRTRTEVQVEGEEVPRRFNLVVKMYPPNEKHRKLIRDIFVFEREIHVYTKLTEQIRAAQDLQKTGGTHLEPFWPKCYYTCTDPMKKVSVIVMNDLVASGYKLMSRKLGLDHDHLLCAMKALARSHALTFNVKWKVGVEQFLLDNVPVLDEPFKAFNQSDMLYDIAVSTIRKLHEEDLANRMEAYRQNLKKSIFNRLIELVQMKGKMSTLTQGDCWINNMMFRIDKSIEVTLLDLQAFRYGNPCLDLTYFLVSSSYIGAREPLDGLLNAYHQAFFDTLREVGNDFSKDEYTLEDVKADFSRYREFGYIIGLIFIPAVMTEGHDMPNFDDTKQDPIKMFVEWVEKKKAEPVPKALGERLLEHVKDMAEHQVI